MFGHDDKDREEKDQAELENVENQDNKDWQHPGTPIDDNNSSDDNQQIDAPDEVIEPSDNKNDKPDDNDNNDFRSHDNDSAPEEPAAPTGHSGASANDLIDIKQDALSKLSPLVGHLDQSPEEKFRTLMMMIQASDDQSLVKEAYETAQKIDDEKERAQALLDIVNEINYFTQNPTKSD